MSNDDDNNANSDTPPTPPSPQTRHRPRTSGCQPCSCTSMEPSSTPSGQRSHGEMKINMQLSIN